MLRTAAIGAVLFSLALTGCTGPGSSGPETTAPSAATSSGVVDELELPLWVAVVGDSNTTGFKTTLADGIEAGTAWISLVEQSDIKFAGGWARNGATSTAMRENVQPAAEADVLVIMAGTNNIAMELPPATLDADLIAISQTVGASHTVLAAIAPFDARPDDALLVNAHLATLAATHGWTFVDPWKDLRTPEGRWAPGFGRDGLHATPDGYQIMALEMRDALFAAFAPGAD